MTWLRTNWYFVSAGVGVLILAALAVYWNDLSVLQRLSVANLGVIFFHFTEEFGLPGGFGKMANTLYFKNSPDITRYPLNQNSVMIGNWSFAILFYIPPIFLPDLIWLGLIPMIFGGVMQLLVHAIFNNRLIGNGNWYNSGLATTALGHVPLFAAYAYFIQTNGIATIWDWVFGFVGAVLAYVVVFRTLIMKPLEDVNSPYPFTPEEMARFDRLYRR